MTPFSELLQRAHARRNSIDTLSTTAYRLLNGDGDGLPGVTLDHLGTVLLIQSEKPPSAPFIAAIQQQFPHHSLYFRSETIHVRRLRKEEASPQWISGPRVPEKFPVLENGLRFLMGMSEGYSTGLFLDQRENRRRILEMDLAGKSVLNAFSYTCAFSVCAAKAGATVTSLDLSKKYLNWGRENFRANNLDDTAHDFIFGDVFDWLPRLMKKGWRFDLIILDPPTFSTTKSGQPFQAEKDYPQLIALAKDCLAPGGRILACINTHDVSAAQFRRLAGIKDLLPLPADFPTAPGTEPHLKAGWIFSTP